ncbi:FtsX-like permease family protein [Tepidibacter hydrothermalis]|uniref:ABC transporter permease n=1 Tax=Tepidibacter hydrothermalis TaxID=3036126 RepID=A0ABY8EAW1_9FIRM|nr:ABC transporter permease [Tepidibacter hydrothermalis]WFD08652.1 ABC transporter permease [Tepidibacter hydrothermalis]
MTIITGEIVIFISSFLFILYSASIFVKVRYKEFGVLIILGMSKKQFNRLIVLENIIIGFLSLTTGIIIGLVFLKFFLIISEKIIAIGPLDFYFPIKAILFTIISFCILFLIISLCIPLLLRTKEINDLLRDSSTIYEEMKFCKTIFILSILMLGFVYKLFNKFSNQILFIMGITTIGSFLFFSQSSIIVIEMLKKRRNFYMNKVNMMWISNLSYSRKINVRVIFLVGILLTVTFTSIGTLYAAKFTIKDDVVSDYPMQFAYLSLPGNNKERQHIKIIEDYLNNDGFKFKKYTAVILHQQIHDKEGNYIIKLSEYNHIATALNMKNIRLKENEAYILQLPYKSEGNIDKLSRSESFFLNNRNIILTRIGIADKNIFECFLSNRLIVVKDNTFNTIEHIGNKNTYYGFQVQDWEKTAGIGDYIYEKLYTPDNNLFVFPNDNPFVFIGAASIFENEKEALRLWFYICFFIGTIFFIAAASFLYFRIYVILNQKKEQYRNISKIGVTIEEIKKASTIQIAILFFTSYIIASVHTYFFIEIIGLCKGASSKVLTVLFIFFVIQFIYFLIIRLQYIKHLSRYIFTDWR